MLALEGEPDDVIERMVDDYRQLQEIMEGRHDEAVQK